MDELSAKESHVLFTTLEMMRKAKACTEGACKVEKEAYWKSGVDRRQSSKAPEIHRYRECAFKHCRAAILALAKEREVMANISLQRAIALKPSKTRDAKIASARRDIADAKRSIESARNGILKGVKIQLDQL